MIDRKERNSARRAEIFNLYLQGVDVREALADDFGDYDDDVDLLDGLECINSMKRFDTRLLRYVIVVAKAISDAGWANLEDMGHL